MRKSLLLVLLLASCGLSPPDDQLKSLDQFEDLLRETYHRKPAGLSRAVAIVKEGAMGPDWLATIHGYPDNKQVCEDLIAPYNADPALSALPGDYSCRPVEQSFE